jgi:hypothetical protein
MGQKQRLDALTKEIDASALANAQLRAEADLMVKERDVLKREAIARAKDWEHLLSGHTDMLALERTRSQEMGELEKSARLQYEKLERRFKQLERAFDQAVARNDSLAEELAAEQSSAKRSRETVTEGRRHQKAAGRSSACRGIQAVCKAIAADTGASTS